MSMEIQLNFFIMIWHSSNGPIEVSKMEDEHVARVINFLMRKYGDRLFLELLLEGRQARMGDFKKEKIKPVSVISPVEAALNAIEHLNGDMACMDAENFLNNYMDPHLSDPYVDDRWEDEYES
jgi:hypothetical protein